MLIIRLANRLKPASSATLKVSITPSVDTRPWATFHLTTLRGYTSLKLLNYDSVKTGEDHKQHLGWAEYQVRSDLAMRRHWQLVCCAFSFCWWEQTYAPETTDTQAPENEPTSNAPGGDPQPDKKKPCCTAAVAELARSVEKGSGVSRTLPHALALLARVVAEAPAA